MSDPMPFLYLSYIDISIVEMDTASARLVRTYRTAFTKRYNHRLLPLTHFAQQNRLICSITKRHAGTGLKRATDYRSSDGTVLLWILLTEGHFTS